MIVQNPRMILVEGPSRGNTYDRTIFREFASSGSKVVFTVWPALYLHEDGPLLVKGVVKVEWTFFYAMNIVDCPCVITVFVIQF
jgi:hypothetical protein